MSSELERIPFLDLVSFHKEIEKDCVEIFQQALRSARFIGGPNVIDFEKEFAKYCQSSYSIGVNSGTDAVRFALLASGIQPGEIVITVPNTFIATTESISQAGGHIQFVDIDERTYNMDVHRLEAYLNEECMYDKSSHTTIHKTLKKKVHAVIPVHLYGQPANMDEILRVCQEFGLKVIEDACQAHGAEYYSEKDKKWKRAGSMGVAAAFSFYPGKNLGACGEGGAVTTQSDSISSTIQMIRDHGQSEKYIHQIEGYNGRLDSIQAGILNIKLQYLDEKNEQRLHHAHYYHKQLQENKNIVIPFEPSNVKPVYHLYVIRVQNREKIQEFLKTKNIDTALHYPIPLHLQKAYQYLNYSEGNFPVTERVSQEILSLPMFPELTQTQQDRVVDALNDYFKQ